MSPTWEDDDEDSEFSTSEEEEDEELVESNRSRGKRQRSHYDDDDDDDDEDDEGRRGRKSRKGSGMQFIDDEAEVDETVENEEDDELDEEDKGFIDDDGTDDGTELQDEGRDAQPGMHRRSSFPLEEENIEELERGIKARYEAHEDYDEDADDIDQQALLPSVRDPKLWMVKCKVGYEREAAACLLNKCIAKGSELNIRSVIALDHLKNYIYVEADREAQVKEACRGLRNVYSANVVLVPLKEMADVLSVQQKPNELSPDTWVRVKAGTYKGDLAKVVDVDNMRQKVTIQLIPRIDLQAIADKLAAADKWASDDEEVVKKVVKSKYAPPQRLMDVKIAKHMNILVERRRDRDTGDVFDMVAGMKFSNGFLFKTMSVKSITTNDINPTIGELEKFRNPDDVEGDISDFSALFDNRKKFHFMKGDTVVVVMGELKNVKGRVEKVEDEIVHIKPALKNFHGTVPLSDKYLCKYFNVGDHVKVVSGVHEGITGMVVKVEGHVLIVVSDTTKENIRVFADHVVGSSEVTTGLARIGDYEMHDLVLLDNNAFGVIVRVEREAFRVLKGNPESSESALVKLREIKAKVEKKSTAQDRCRKVISVKDIVRIVEGPYKDRQGSVEHVYSGVIFIIDRHHHENAGYICARAQSCIVKGGSDTDNDRNQCSLQSYRPKAPPPLRRSYARPSPRSRDYSSGQPAKPSSKDDSGAERPRYGRPRHHLVGTHVTIRSGAFKGYRGAVKEVNGQTVRVELESQMRVVTVNLDAISSQKREAELLGSETPMHYATTPFHEGMRTPMRDPAWAPCTPFHEGMRTPMQDPAWAPYTPMYEDVTTPMYDPAMTP